MRYEATISADIDPIVLESIKYELEQVGRSKVEILKEKNIIFKISADDSIALRATLNGITKLLTAYEKIEGIEK